LSNAIKRLALLSLLAPFLAFWSWQMQGLVTLPVKCPSPVGIVLALFGLGFLAAGVQALLSQGSGLPAYIATPASYVEQRIYKIVPHPIYAGIALLCGGISIALQSPSGLWLVTPLLILGLAAVVLGEERRELRSRFGPDAPIRHIIPPAGQESPRGRSRIFAYTCLLLPWMFLYEAVIMLGEPPDVIRTHFGFENSLPVIEWTEFIYASPYVITCLLPLFCRTRDQLRLFMYRGVVTMGAVFPIYLAIPLISPHRQFTAGTAMGQLLQAERALDGSGAAFPSYHVLWSLISADVLIAIWPQWKWAWRVWPVLVGISCISTGSHAVVDVIAAFVAFWLIKRIPLSWAERKPMIVIWTLAILIAVARLDMIGTDPHVTAAYGLIMAGAGFFVDRRNWLGPALAASGVAATILR